MNKVMLNAFYDELTKIANSSGIEMDSKHPWAKDDTFDMTKKPKKKVQKDFIGNSVQGGMIGGLGASRFGTGAGLTGMVLGGGVGAGLTAMDDGQ
jgi:hypothetical protein